MILRSPFAKSEKPKKRKQRQYIVTTDGNVFPYATLELAAIMKKDSEEAKTREEIAKDSDQSTGQSKVTTADVLATKPFDPAIFHWMAGNSIYFQSCVEQTASDIAGTGYKVKLKEETAEAPEQEDKVLAFLEDPNWEYEIEEVWQSFLIDYNQIGYAGFELVRNLEEEDGLIKEIWHMNASRLWVHKDKKTGLFAEKSGVGIDEKKWFVRFGMTDDDGKPVQVDKKTGKAGSVEFAKRAHEIVYAKRYYWGSSYYGAPPIAPASGEVVMGVGARDYNIAFFLNYGVPAMLVMLSGEWEDDVDPDEEGPIEIIKRELEKIKGGENSHGSVVFQTPEGCKMEVQILAVETKEGSFRLAKADIAQDVLVAYRMPPYRIGLPVAGALAGDVADEMLRTYKTARVEPGQLMLERIMNRIFRLGLGVENYELKLNDMVLWDEKAQAEINATRLRTGQVTHNQLLREQGKQHLEFVGGNSYYMESNLLDIGEDVTE